MKSRSLHVYALFVACAGFLVVVAGGLVTSTGSGLSVPDWPLSFGRFFPPMVGGVLFEHGHRLLAGLVGLLTFILVGAIWFGDRRRDVRIIAGAAVATVFAQALLGGLTVLLRLPPAVSIAHACLGQTFFCLLVCLAVLTGESPSPAPGGPLEVRRLQRLGVMTTIFMYWQLIAGATLRHSGLSWAFHLHLLGALLVTVHVILLAKRAFRRFSHRPDLCAWAFALIGLLGFQLVFGFYAWRTGWVAVTTVHVGIGALLLASSVVLTMQSYRGWLEIVG